MTVRIEAPPPKWDAETSVAIVGAGAAGLTAALSASDAGADVLVLERDPRPAGSTAMSSGFVPAAGTRWQRALGIEDGPHRLLADIVVKARARNNPLVASTAAREIGPALEWLADAHGLEWQVLEGFLYPGHRRHRMHAVPERTGAGLIARLATAVATAGVPIMTEARVEILAVADHTIAGLGIRRPDGALEWLRTGAVILACNGYGGAPDLVRRHIPEIADGTYHGHAGNTGDALIWGEALGAKTRDLGAYQGHGNLAHPHGILITWALMMEGGIQVNAGGQRFSNEHEGYSEQGVKVLAQPGGVAWSVYDARLHALGREFPDYREAEAAGAVRRGNGAAGLAQSTGLPEDALSVTLADTRSYAAGTAADPFGRDFTGSPALTDDLFAIRVTGALFHTQGGLDIDGEARVLRQNGDTFVNLYAAGGAACGVSGDSVWGYLSGNGLLTAIALGYVAGGHAGTIGRFRLPHR